jgi:hypothetical protein
MELPSNLFFLNPVKFFYLFKIKFLIIYFKVVNSVSISILFFLLEWNVSVSECFGVPFRGYTVLFIYIYSTNIIQIQDKLIINYAIQTQCQTNIILKFKIFLNSED